MITKANPNPVNTTYKIERKAITDRPDEVKRITMAVGGTGIYNATVKPVGDKLLVIIPEKELFGYQLTQLQEIAKGYSLSIVTNGVFLVVKIW